MALVRKQDFQFKSTCMCWYYVNMAVILPWV